MAEATLATVVIMSFHLVGVQKTRAAVVATDKGVMAMMMMTRMIDPPMTLTLETVGLMIWRPESPQAQAVRDQGQDLVEMIVIEGLERATVTKVVQLEAETGVRAVMLMAMRMTGPIPAHRIHMRSLG